MNELILRYITMPMAIKIFKDDKDNFKPSKVNRLYYDLIDSVLDQLQQDFNELKADMYSKHHLDIKRIDKLKYRVNKDVVEFTAAELRNKTEEIMKEYLTKVEFVERQRPLYN